MRLPRPLFVLAARYARQSQEADAARVYWEERARDVAYRLDEAQAVIVALRGDVQILNDQIRVLMTTCPSDLREMEA